MADAENTPDEPAAAPFDFQALAVRASADNPDAALFDALEAFGEQERIYKRERCGETLWRAVAEAKAAQDRLAAPRPATLEGLLAKLRHAAARTHRAPAFVAQHAALMDTIAWLAPPKPKRGRAIGKRARPER